MDSDWLTDATMFEMDNQSYYVSTRRNCLLNRRLKRIGYLIYIVGCMRRLRVG